jgi:hypothetical protein
VELQEKTKDEKAAINKIFINELNEVIQKK